MFVSIVLMIWFILEDLASSICSDEIKTKGQVTNQLILILSDWDFFSVTNVVLSFGVRTRHSVVYCGGIDQELFQDELFSVCRGSAASCLLPSRCQSSQLPVAKSECPEIDEEVWWKKNQKFPPSLPWSFVFIIIVIPHWGFLTSLYTLAIKLVPNKRVQLFFFAMLWRCRCYSCLWWWSFD